jgi:hypothetical protein
MTSRSKLISHQLNQTAVYWANPVNDGFGGRTFDNPAELSVRWEQRQELFTDSAGQEKRSNAVVYVAQTLVVGEYLFLGDLDDLSSAEEGDPLTVAAAYEIRSIEEVTDIPASRTVRKVWL